MTLIKRLNLWILILALGILAASLPASLVQSQNKRNRAYYPPAGDAWQRRAPEEVGMDHALLDDAVAYARTQAGTMPKDFSTQTETFGRVLGPLPKMHGDTNGIILRHGYIVAEWGDTNQIDPVYSVAKSFLSTLTGLAV